MLHHAIWSGADNVTATNALRFLVHFVGDVHQPLHVGFTSDMGGNTIKVKFFSTSTNLHSVWDTYIIQHHIDTDLGGDEDALITELQSMIKGKWALLVPGWESCPRGHSSCPGSLRARCGACALRQTPCAGKRDRDAWRHADPWALESIKDACAYAYKDADPGSDLSVSPCRRRRRATPCLTRPRAGRILRACSADRADAPGAGRSTAGGHFESPLRLIGEAACAGAHLSGPRRPVRFTRLRREGIVHGHAGICACAEPRCRMCEDGRGGRVAASSPSL